MAHFDKSLYSAAEKIKLQDLNQLFDDWKSQLETFSFKDQMLSDLLQDGMTEDGFYPGYLDQKVKILFIGRESRYLTGQNYISTLYNAYKENCVDNRTLNQSVFHRRMFYLAYSLQNELKTYPEIPYASELAETFGTSGLSFAFMNLSKFSNESKNFQSNFEVISKFVDVSTNKRNFILEQIGILNPDIIFTMNISDYFENFLFATKIKEIYRNDRVIAYMVHINNKPVILIDTFHFSAVMKENEKFFIPIIAAIRNVKGQFNFNISDKE